MVREGKVWYVPVVEEGLPGSIWPLLFVTGRIPQTPRLLPAFAGTVYKHTTLSITYNMHLTETCEAFDVLRMKQPTRWARLDIQASLAGPD